MSRREKKITSLIVTGVRKVWNSTTDCTTPTSSSSAMVRRKHRDSSCQCQRQEPRPGRHPTVPWGELYHAEDDDDFFALHRVLDVHRGCTNLPCHNTSSFGGSRVCNVHIMSSATRNAGHGCSDHPGPDNANLHVVLELFLLLPAGHGMALGFRFTRESSIGVTQR